MMTKREQYLRALHNEPTDEIVWAPNFDYWLHAGKAEGTVSERYRGMSDNVPPNADFARVEAVAGLVNA